MSEEAFLVAYLRELGQHLDIDIRSALDCADAAYEDDPDGDPVEAAETEAAEWRRSS